MAKSNKVEKNEKPLKSVLLKSCIEQRGKKIIYYLEVKFSKSSAYVLNECFPINFASFIITSTSDFLKKI